MTEPVDTDALRDLQALSGGILSRNMLEGSGVWKINRDVTRALGTAADEVDRLRAVIENAPHREHCRPHIACICWKADAL